MLVPDGTAFTGFTHQANCICVSPDFYSLEYFRRSLLGEGRLCERGGGDEPDWDDVFRPLVSHHRGRRMSHVTVVQNYQSELIYIGAHMPCDKARIM